MKMARKNKPIEVDIRETDKHKGDTTDLEVVVKKKIIGTIHQEANDRHVSVEMSSGKKRQVASVDEAIETIIAEYNLHDL